jgi:hypothetical protein
MRQSIYGLLLLVILSLPPVADLFESIMIIHMHMQMPLLVFSGFLMARYFQIRFPGFFETWNHNGLPGIILFVIISVYWMIPRTMDEALTLQSMEIFKFFSLSLLAGVPLRDSWKKLGSARKNVVFIVFALMFLGMGLLYIYSPVQLCNNYLIIEQITLGWGFLTMAICIAIYLLYVTFTDPSQYEISPG